MPLHPSTAEHLHHYDVQRARLHYAGLSDAFFISERGQPLQYGALQDWFARLCQRVGIVPAGGGRKPCLMPTFRTTLYVIE